MPDRILAGEGIPPARAVEARQPAQDARAAVDDDPTA